MKKLKIIKEYFKLKRKGYIKDYIEKIIINMIIQ